MAQLDYDVAVKIYWKSLRINEIRKHSRKMA